MPAYCFKCNECGRKEQVVRLIADRNEPVSCNDCSSDMSRDLQGEFGGFRNTPGNWPLLSDAMAVHPDQIAEATSANRRNGTNVGYTPDGRAIFESRAQRKAHCQAYGYHDNSGGYGDA
jgi:putative FmdB family regulatory protein